VLCALASLVLNKRLSNKLAMTGEISLRGSVLPVGGIKEKLLASHRHGIQEIILPRGNAKDLDDLPKDARAALRIHFVETMNEVLALALDGTSNREAKFPSQAKAKVSAVVMVSELRQVNTRKGDRMAVLQLEDLTGSCEAVVFPKSYARLADHLMVDARLLVWASVDRRDERVQLIVDDCRSIDDLQLLMVELQAEQAADIAIQHRLRECLHRHRPPQDEVGSRVPVVALVRHLDDIRFVRLGPQFCVADVAAALDTLASADFQARVSSPLVAA
jgi:DNA polymerase III alpha subunit